MSTLLYGQDREKVFTQIFAIHYWQGGAETVSGSGSTLEATKNIRKEIPKLLKKFSVHVFLDAPCGDFNWMKHVDLSSIDQYIGIDIVQKIIAQNNQKYRSQTIQFEYADIVKDPLPKADLVLCRDCFIHLSFKEILAVIENLKRSNIKYLLVSTYPPLRMNHEIQKTGAIRYVNLEKAPFNFPKPLKVIQESHDERKVLALWKLDDIS